MTDKALHRKIPWASREGRRLFDRARHKEDFFQLVPHFQAQANPVYCGVACAVILLNSFFPRHERSSQKELEIQTPLGRLMDFCAFSQATLLSQATEHVKRKSVVMFEERSAGKYDPGFSLSELSHLLSYYGLHVDIHQLTDYESECSLFLEVLEDHLIDDSSRVIVNFDGRELGCKTRGHLTLVGAYEEEEGMALLLEVAGHLEDWFWIDTKSLVKAMQVKEADFFRGYLSVRR